jgi:Family of unknown function (DUF5706)
MSRRSRLRSLLGPAPASSAAGKGNRAAEFAWHVHDAQESWASNADVKASILLALEGGGLYAIISALGRGGLLARAGGWQQHIADPIGMFSLLLAILAATIAIFPRLEHKKRDHNRQRQAIYFGDLRRWSSAELTSYLADLTEQHELDALSRQLIDMAGHNWVKHHWVQLSLFLAVAGIFIISAAALAAL